MGLGVMNIFIVYGERRDFFLSNKMGRDLRSLL